MQGIVMDKILQGSLRWEVMPEMLKGMFR